MNRIIAENVRRIRHERGMTQNEVAAAGGFSRAGYRKIEAGESLPRTETLQSIARALQVPVRDLVTPIRALEKVRFRSFRRLRSRGQVLARVSRWLEDFGELEEMLRDRQPYRLADAMNATYGEAESSPELAAASVREAFGLSPWEPIRDICGLLESKGIKVLPVEIASDAFFGLSVAPGDGGPAIVVNTWKRISVERWIFTAAHELGHLVLHLHEYNVGEQQETERHEQEANRFAGHFLMPDEVFWQEWEETYGMAFIDRILKVKRMFRVSYRTVLFRLAQSMQDPTEVWKKFQVAYKRQHGRTLLKADEPEALVVDEFRASSPEALRAGEPDNLSASDFQEDRLVSLVRRAVEDGLITLSRAAEILGFSLREMRQLSAAWMG